MDLDTMMARFETRGQNGEDPFAPPMEDLARRRLLDQQIDMALAAVHASARDAGNWLHEYQRLIEERNALAAIPDAALKLIHATEVAGRIGKARSLLREFLPSPARWMETGVLAAVREPEPPHKHRSMTRARHGLYVFGVLVRLSSSEKPEVVDGLHKTAAHINKRWREWFRHQT